MSSQTAIPCLFMRGGTSRGPFFDMADLPQDTTLRDQVLLAALGSPDKRQIDGLGGAHSLTSKVGMVCLGSQPGVDLEFLFAQLQPEKSTVDTKPNCGNMLAAVVPFALERGMITAQGDTTTVRVLTRNTGMLSDITVATPGGEISYEGSARIDGVPGTCAPVQISFLDTAGSVAGSLLPTDPAFAWQAFCDEPLDALLPVDHPLAQHTEIGLEELADTPFLMYQRSFVLNDRLLQACQQLGFTPRESGRSGQADFLVALVAAGQGVVLLPSVDARGLERPGVVRLTLRAPQFLRWDIAFIWRKGAYLSKAALAWLALLREYPISRAVR